MTVWLSLLGGLILGWLIEWIIDWYYWRRGAEAFYIAENELRRELTAAQQQAAEAQAANETLRAQLAQAQQELDRLRVKPGANATPTAPASPAPSSPAPSKAPSSPKGGRGNR